ncbi:MAG: NAD(+) diphosphatase [Lachnospiraceae bacterium]|nr:NAD(+) diphosphatase [Lachnospiraceae bacterium]
MIQDILPKFLDNQYKDKKPKEGDYVFCVSDAGVLIKDSDELLFPKYDGSNFKDLIYLFSIDDDAFFLSDDNTVTSDDAPEGYVFKTMHQLRPMAPMHMVLAAATAWHLYIWYRDNKFCGRCGKKTTHDKALRMKRCECGNMIFPKIAPAVIVGVTKGNKILMTKYKDRAYTRYALIAGFIEIGEEAEETVRREVLEEAGIKVKNIRYYKSQPWGFDSNLLLGYFCEADGDDEIVFDNEELSCAIWADRDMVPDYGENLALTHEMMQVFKNNEKF